MDKPAEVDTIHEPISFAVQVSFLNVPHSHKAYCSVAYPSHAPGSSHIFVIDTRTSTLVDSFWVGQMISDMCLDHTGDFVYGAALADSALLVIDARVDSVVTTVRLPPSWAARKNSLVLNRITNRIYQAQYDDQYRYGNVIPVIRDSMLIGLEEPGPFSSSRGVGPTLFNRGVPLRATVPAVIFDATGRRVLDLEPGANDVRRLAPGVYFLRGPKTEDGRPDAAVRKVVITR